MKNKIFYFLACLFFTSLLPAQLVVDLGPDITICNGVSTPIYASVNGGFLQNCTYTWSNGVTSSNYVLYVSNPGSYCVSVMDSLGNTGSDCITVSASSASPLVLTASPTSTCLSGGQATLNAAATGGTTPYSYSWINLGVSGTQAVATSAGNYTVTVTDANACSATQTITVNDVPQVSLVGSQVPTCTGIYIGDMLSADNGAGSTFSWSPVGGFGDSLFATTSGTYTLTQTNACGSTSASINVTVPNPITVSISPSTSVICLTGGQATLTAVPSGGTSPYYYTWFGGATTPYTSAITVTAVGSYYLYVTDANGCSAQDNVQVSNIPQVALAAATTNNCQAFYIGDSLTLDNGYGNTYSWNTGQTNWDSLHVTNPGTYTLTQTNACGSASASITITTMPTPFSSVTITATPNCISPLGTVLSATTTGGNGPISYHWYALTLGQISNASSFSINQAMDLQLYVYDSLGCTSSSGISLAACTNTSKLTGYLYHDTNGNGTKDAGENGLSGIAITAQPGNLTVFSNWNGYYELILAPNVNYTVTANIWNTISPVPASQVVLFPNANMTSTQNFGYTPPPVYDLGIYSCWTGGMMSPGTSHSFYLDYENYGTTIQNAIVTLQLPSLTTFVSSSPMPSSVNGNTLSWTINNLQPYAWSYINIIYTIATTAQSGDVLPFIVDISPIANDITPSNNHYVHTRIVGNSYDPNDKQVYPEGNISPTFVANQDYLNYTIHFQNLGTAPAINILVKDELSQNVDWETMEVTASSHNYVASIQNGVLQFNFPNIMLADSASNEPASHGYVSYRIRTKNNLVIGDAIENTAAIYFDYNEPVITNTTVNTVSLINGIAQTKLGDIHFYPNPAKDKLELDLGTANDSYQVKIIDLTGRVQQNYIIANKQHEILDISKLVQGAYILQIQSEKGTFSSIWMKE